MRIFKKDRSRAVFEVETEEPNHQEDGAAAFIITNKETGSKIGFKLEADEVRGLMSALKNFLKSHDNSKIELLNKESTNYYEREPSSYEERPQQHQEIPSENSFRLFDNPEQTYETREKPKAEFYY